MRQPTNKKNTGCRSSTRGVYPLVSNTRMAFSASSDIDKSMGAYPKPLYQETISYCHSAMQSKPTQKARIIHQVSGYHSGLQ